MLTVTLESSLSGQVSVCVCVPEYMCVCVCVVTDRSRVPVQLLSELAGTYGGVPWAASQKD